MVAWAWAVTVIDAIGGQSAVGPFLAVLLLVHQRDDDDARVDAGAEAVKALDDEKEAGGDPLASVQH